MTEKRRRISNVRWFKKRESVSAAPVQLRNGEQHPFGMLGD